MYECLMLILLRKINIDKWNIYLYTNMLECSTFCRFIVLNVSHLLIALAIQSYQSFHTYELQSDHNTFDDFNCTENTRPYVRLLFKCD